VIAPLEPQRRDLQTIHGQGAAGRLCRDTSDIHRQQAIFRQTTGEHEVKIAGEDLRIGLPIRLLPQPRYVEDLSLQVSVRQNGEYHCQRVVRRIRVLQPSELRGIRDRRVPAVRLPQLKPLAVQNIIAEELVGFIFTVQGWQDRALWGLNLQHQVEYPIHAEGRHRCHHGSTCGDRTRQAAAEGVHHRLLPRVQSAEKAVP